MGLCMCVAGFMVVLQVRCRAVQTHDCAIRGRRAGVPKNVHAIGAEGAWAKRGLLCCPGVCSGAQQASCTPQRAPPERTPPRAAGSHQPLSLVAGTAAAALAAAPAPAPALAAAPNVLRVLGRNPPKNGVPG